MKDKEQILKLLNDLTAYKFDLLYVNFTDILNKYKILTNEDIEQLKDDEIDINILKELQQLNIEIVYYGYTRLNQHFTQIVLKINDVLYATDGYYSSYDNDNYCNEWYIAQEIITPITEYKPII